jgi:hypothetical protein
MRIRDKIITAACLIPGGIEWTTLKVRQDETERVEQDALFDPDSEGSTSSAYELDDTLSERLQGDLTVSIRTSELLMRSMEFPTTDREEIRGMVNFQIDKISPFPLDQLAISHEILHQTEQNSQILMVAIKRDRIDALGDLFLGKGLHIHSIDARILGWLSLLKKGGHLADDGCQILIVDDGIDFALAVLLNGIPIVFRSLPPLEDDRNPVDELAREIGYTLTVLDTEHELPPPDMITIWSHLERSPKLESELSAQPGLTVQQMPLTTLPPLSEGIIDRTLQQKSRIELIPREWVEHKKKQRLKKQFLLSSALIGIVWIIAMLVFTGIYQTRAIALNKVQKKEAALAPQANQAIQNRKKLLALESYADRSDSALECLREITRLLPTGDIEFVSFNYNKSKGVTLRGTAEGDDTVYEFFDALGGSTLFAELKDQRIDTKVTKGIQRSVFSANLLLPTKEENR